MPPFDFDQLWLKSGPLAPEHVAKVIWAPTLYLRGKKKNKTKKGIDFNTSAATMAEEDKKGIRGLDSDTKKKEIKPK